MLRRKTLCLLFLTGLTGYLVRCEETLPPRLAPQNVLEVAGVNYMQGIDKGGLPYMAFVITIRNNYDEVFQEKVNITGTMTIWMRGRPDLLATMEIRNGNIAAPSNFIGNTLTLEPGGKCFLQLYWYLYFNDGQYLANMFGERPVEMVMEAEFRIFSQIGYLKTEPLAITYTAHASGPSGRAASFATAEDEH